MRHPAPRTLPTICLLVALFAYAAAAHGICAALGSLLPRQLALPGDSAYTTSESSYAYANQQTQKPSCIVKPTCAADVSLVVKTLRKYPGSPFAIRSGGHATNRGFSNIDGGVTVDLTSLNTVRLLGDGVTVSVGTGALWGDVYSGLDRHNRSLNGGRASGVGVGGLLSGGNPNPLSPSS